MSTITPSTLAELVVDALERTAFLLTDAMPPEAQDEFDRPTWFSTIDYHGAFTGSVYLAASEGFVRELASSLLGIEPEDVDMVNQGRDAINELANIVGGSVTLELGSDTQQFSLGLPAKAESGEIPKAGDRTTQCFIESEGELLVVTHVFNASSNKAAA
ncbi:MAG: chemotaxis protein CheX [Phycisphaerales bacterium]